MPPCDYNGDMSGAALSFSGRRYNSYGTFLRRKFGCRVNKVIVDAGFTCPNRDGTAGFGGCTYCDNDAFRPPSADRTLPLPVQIETGMRFLRRRYGAEKFIVYFQPFSNTYAPLEELVPLYESALAHEDVVGLAVGTRADCVDEAKISWFETLARRSFVTLEYGLESVHDATLERIRRGHDYARFVRALDMTKGRGIFTCAHVILGFPWETAEAMLQAADAISKLGVDFVKLHQLHIVRNTAMGAEYERSPFPLPAFEDYVDLVVRFLERLSPRVCVERLSAVAPAERLLGPIWGKSRAEVQRAVESELAARDTWQGRRCREAADP